MLTKFLRASVKRPRPTFVATGLESSVTGSNLIINKPTGTTTGDLMIAFYSADVTGVSWTPPIGWTEVVEYTGRAGIGVAWKIATASEGTTYSFTFSGGGSTYNGFIATYRGAAYDVSGTATNSATSSVAISGITVTSNNSIALAFVAQSNNSATFTPASGFSSLASDLSNRPASQLWSRNVESGATGNQTFTSTNSGNLSGVLVSIKPS